jgi:steroid 5-alpha reductase family enzyme
LSDAVTAMLVAAVAIAVLMLATWSISLLLRNASIVDLVWGLGFVLVAWAVRLSVDGNAARQWLLVGMATVWGLRLTLYLTWRNVGPHLHREPHFHNEEDYRYQAMRRHWGARFWWVSLFTVFALQGVLMWIVSLSVQLGQVPESPGLGVLAGLGVLVWAVGLGFEAVGDAQLARFKRDPANAGKVMDQGLWRYTRHPNYFGDAVVWWGLYAFALATGHPLTIVGPLIRKVSVAKFTRTLGTMISSGVPILEALEITAKTAGNSIVEDAIMATRKSIEEGKTISEPLKDTEVFPPMVVHMIAVGEQTGALDTMLSKIADFYEDEVDAAVANMLTLLEPIMILFLGIVIGGIVVSMYLPMFSLLSKIG